MPVIFSTPTSHDVLMLNKDAESMLKAMKTSGNIPGALFAEAVPDALNALKQKINEQESIENNDDEESADDDYYVSFNKKALPLIELMQRAIDQEEKLLWDNE